MVEKSAGCLDKSKKSKEERVWTETEQFESSRQYWLDLTTSAQAFSSRFPVFILDEWSV